ncbi:MAG TPA: type II toxin-antitoxin system RelE/ParE family toxin [Bdellovibrio sp.]
MTQPKRTAVYYLDSNLGNEPAKEWLDSLNDKMAKVKIMARIARAEMGNFGQWKSVGNGVLELKINYGPGYRVNYALVGSEIILLLVGGDKSTQSKDIARAKMYLKKHRNEEK